MNREEEILGRLPKKKNRKKKSVKTGNEFVKIFSKNFRAIVIVLAVLVGGFVGIGHAIDLSIGFAVGNFLCRKLL